MNVEDVLRKAMRSSNPKEAAKEVVSTLVDLGATNFITIGEVIWITYEGVEYPFVRAEFGEGQ